MTTTAQAARLEYLRQEIRAERISYSELAELADLAPFIDPGDVELLEWAGVPESPDSRADTAYVRGLRARTPIGRAFARILEAFYRAIGA